MCLQSRDPVWRMLVREVNVEFGDVALKYCNSMHLINLWTQVNMWNILKGCIRVIWGSLMWIYCTPSCFVNLRISVKKKVFYVTWQIFLHIFHLVYINGGSDPNLSIYKTFNFWKVKDFKLFFCCHRGLPVTKGLVTVIDPNGKMNDVVHRLESVCGIEEEESDAVRKRHQSLLKIGKKTNCETVASCLLADIAEFKQMKKQLHWLCNDYEESGCDVLDWYYIMV